MNDSMRLYWNLYFDWYSNEKILSNSYNPIKDYYTNESGKIVDIGCGQSRFLLDFLNTGFELFAVDTESKQLEFLKRRVELAGHTQDRISYFNKDFFEIDFKTQFDIIILSNLLHFYPLNEVENFIKNLDKYSKKNSLYYIKVHSENHNSNTKKEENNYFKSFFSNSKLSDLFPTSKFSYLYYIEKEATIANYEETFIKNWIAECIKETNSKFNVEAAQEDYLKKNNKINSIEVIVKRK